MFTVYKASVVKEADKKVKRHENFLKMGRLVELLVVAGIAVVVFLIIYI